MTTAPALGGFLRLGRGIFLRSSNSDMALELTTPKPMPLEAAIERIEEDELVEVTPKSGWSLRPLWYRSLGMTKREQIHQAIDALGDRELQAVAHVVAALRASRHPPLEMDPRSYGPLYHEFAEEDRALAEQGMARYAEGLGAEDRS